MAKKNNGKESASKPIWSIDKDNLDAECILFPKQFAEYAEQLPAAKSEVDRTKAAMELAVSELDGEIRADPESFGLEKVTEAGIKSALPGTKKYQKALQRYLDAKEHYETLQAAMEVLRAKKSSLEFLIQLHSMSYFSSVNTKIKSK